MELSNEVMHKRIADLKKRAEAAYDKNNFLWAAELYGEIYSLDRTNNIEFLQKMILSALGNKNISKNQYVFIIKSFFTNLPYYFKALKLKKLPEMADELYSLFESIIRNNPDSQFAILQLSTIYEKNNLPENAAIILESLLRLRKDNITILRRIGDLYMHIQKIEKARAVFKKILDLKPYDQDSEKKLRDILALTSIDESKLRGSDYKNSIKDKDSSYKAQIEMKTQKTVEELLYLINEKQKEIKEHPLSLPLRYDLLQYYSEMKDKKNILNTLKAISEISPGDINILLEKIEAEIDIYENSLKENKDCADNPKEILTRLNAFKKNKYLELKQQFPTNADLNFQLAKIFFDLNENDEALKLFQICSKSSDLSPISKNYMGNIFIRKKMYDMAIDQFEKGISELSEMNNLKKELIYTLGLTLEKLGKKEEALSKYKLIYKEDVGYKDISKKIEESYNQKN